MKLATIVAFVALLAVPTEALGQGTVITPQQAAEVKQGRTMVIGGALLAVAGLAVFPITASNSNPAKGTTLAASVGLVGGGAGLAWFGARKMRNASRPETTFGVAAGSTKGVFIRRAW